MNRRLSTLDGRSHKLDGGVMFGNTPRHTWLDWIRPDHDNLVQLASRGLLVQQGDRNILVLAGASALLAPPRRACTCQKHVPGLLESLAQQGLTESDINTVVLSHLHAQLSPETRAAIDDGDTPRLLFPAARYITGERHWFRALHNHPHDRALFVRQIVHRLEGSGRLMLVEGGRCKELGDGWRLHFSEGYTPGQLIPEIAMPGGPVVFAGDLIPGTHWLSLAVTTANDRNPEGIVGEKERLLDYLVANGGRLFFASDPDIAMIKVMRDKQSRYLPFDTYAVLSRFES
ncbi:MBL fold metallo-hydrolase [Pseudomonas sp. WJP1]|uniref:MBL fold metallo-hydrolase n=1 Tax=Pseudomonas sp. WJP1 TaxID=2986947 RepID=UPI00234AC6A4|nr:MBL fold metallo-hydrolase [Pseudomonas sp. WJP1]WCM49140.1 MBL fold metallo-hydrolase [Pseudomonas sp. WJP1]